MPISIRWNAKSMTHILLVKQGVEITSELMKLKYLGKDVIRHYLMEVFDEHNTKMKALLGKGFQPNMA